MAHGRRSSSSSSSVVPGTPDTTTTTTTVEPSVVPVVPASDTLPGLARPFTTATYRVTFGAYAPGTLGTIDAITLPFSATLIGIAAAFRDVFGDVGTWSADTVPSVDTLATRLRDRFTFHTGVDVPADRCVYGHGMGSVGIADAQNMLYAACAASGVPYVRRWSSWYVATWVAFVKPQTCGFATTAFNRGYFGSTMTLFVGGTHGNAIGTGHRDVVRAWSSMSGHNRPVSIVPVVG